MSDANQSAEGLAILHELNLDYVKSYQASDAKRLTGSSLRISGCRLQVSPAPCRVLEYIVQPRSFKDLAVHDVETRILSDVALIHGRTDCTMLADGAERGPLYTDPYQKREGTRGVCLGLGDRSRRLTRPAQGPGVRHPSTRRGNPHKPRGGSEQEKDVVRCTTRHQ